MKTNTHKAGSMNKIHFEVGDDVVIKYTPMPVFNCNIVENSYKTEVVMTKQIFQECYRKWIELQTESKETVLSSEIVNDSGEG